MLADRFLQFVRVKAYVDENAVGKHDIVFGQKFCAELGLILGFKHNKVIWDDISIPMRKSLRHEETMEISDDPG